MSLYSQFAVSQEKEQNGVDVQYAPNKDGTIPTFTIARAAKANKAYSKALEKATRPYRRQIDLGTMDNSVAERLFMDVFIRTLLIGWQNVRNQDGTPMEFSEVNANKLFTALPELYEDLQNKANSAALFRDDNLEEEAKN